MRSHLPEEPVGRLSDAWCCCVRTGRFELALWRDYQDSLAVPLGTPTFLPFSWAMELMLLWNNGAPDTCSGDHDSSHGVQVTPVAPVAPVVGTV